jgi:hypothetical protein
VISAIHIVLFYPIIKSVRTCFITEELDILVGAKVCSVALVQV